MREPQAALQGDLTTLRPATAADADRLVRWHEDPDVARYWDDETYTREEMLLRLARPDVDAYVIEKDGVPIGFIQAWFEDDPTKPCGLDMFLIPAARGAGLGPDAARTLADRLLGASQDQRLTVDPYLSNEVAIRAWGRAGFQPVEEREADDEHPGGPWLLMVFDRSTVRPASR